MAVFCIVGAKDCHILLVKTLAIHKAVMNFIQARYSQVSTLAIHKAGIIESNSQVAIKVVLRDIKAPLYR